MGIEKSIIIIMVSQNAFKLLRKFSTGGGHSP